MINIAGFTETGRRFHGPGSDLVEFSDERGLKHTAIAFHPEYKSHPAINAALSVIEGFLESPMVMGLVDLVENVPDEGVFLYCTGQGWSVAEVIRAYADRGSAPGVRAGLELMYAAGEILTEAAEAGEHHGVYSHGGLTPLRIMIKPDGQVQIIGYGVPQVEILQFHADPDAVPREDSFRYCPPERMEAGQENLSSDLFGLALIAFEMMTGKPVYDGLARNIRAMASRAEGSRRLFRYRELLPDAVRELLRVALRRDIEDRYPDGQSFLHAVSGALGGSEVEGPSLMDVMGVVEQSDTRTGSPLKEAATEALTPEKREAFILEQEACTGRAPPPRARRPARSSSVPVGLPSRSSRQGRVPPSPPSISPRTRRPGDDDPAEAPPPKPSAPEPVSDPGEPSSSGDKWRKVRRGRRRAPRISSTDDSRDAVSRVGADDPSPPREPEADAPNGASSTAADKVVEAIMSSSSRPARPRRPRRKPPSLESSSDTGDPPSPGGESKEAEADSSPSGAEKGNGIYRRRVSRRRRPSRAVDEDLAPPTPVSGDDASSGSDTPAPSPPPLPSGLGSQEMVVPEKGRSEGPSSDEDSGGSSEDRRPSPPTPDQPPPPPRLGQPLDVESLSRSTPPGDPPPPPRPTGATPREAPPSPPASSQADPGGRRAASSPPPVPEDQPPPPPAEDPADDDAATRVRPAPAPRKPKTPPPEDPPESTGPDSSGSPSRGEPAGSESDPPKRTADPPAVAEPDPGFGKWSVDASPAAPAETGGARDSLPWRIADRVPRTSKKGGTVTFRLRLGPGGRLRPFRLPLKAPASEAIAWLLGTLIPLRTDACGRITGWYRLVQDGRRLGGAQDMSEVDADEPLDLLFVENRTLLVDLEVRVKGSTVKLRQPVGTAVPMCALVDHLASLFRLPPGDWRVMYAGRVLHPHEILADQDWNPQEPLVVLET